MQQVNLYVAEFPPKESIKISGKVSSIIIIIAVVLIAATSAAYWKIETLRSEYEQFKKSASLSELAIKKVKTELNKSADDDRLKIDLLSIKDKLRHKQALKDQIDEESVDISTSFHTRFTALSKQDVRGLWLTKISFSDRGQEITLTGATRNADLFTEYVKKLSNEAIFSGVSFRVLHLDTGNENNPSNIINFTLSTNVIEDDTENLSDAEKMLDRYKAMQR